MPNNMMPLFSCYIVMNSEKGVRWTQGDHMQYGQINTIEPRHEKTCLRVCDHGRLKQACAATEAKWRLLISDIET